MTHLGCKHEALLNHANKLTDVVGLAITSGSRQSCVGLSQLDEDLLRTDYVNGLTNTFMDQWDRSRPRKRSSRVRPE
jgi:hypothetical protein